MIEYTQFKNIILHTKPHKRFLIVNTSIQDIIKEFYLRLKLELNFPTDIEVLKINKDLKIENGDLVWIDTYGLNTEELIEQILKFSSSSFFELISNEILETYLFTKLGDSKDMILEGQILKYKGEIRHFILKQFKEYSLYSPLKLWTQRIEAVNIEQKIPEGILFELNKMLEFGKKNFIEKPKLNLNLTPINDMKPKKCWVVWGLPLIYQLDLDENSIFLENENTVYDFSQIKSKLEDFSIFLNCDFFEIDLHSGEISFYDSENIPEWLDKFLTNSWRHGYFKYYYPELCF